MTGWYEVKRNPITKADGLILLCNLVGCALEDLAVFGDNKNDVEMFRIAGSSVAVKNATNECMQEADYFLKNDIHDFLLSYLRNNSDLSEGK
jgi:hydroxymethylpyrimidine pyrophosphatase-like HAD family hydrolase